MDPPVWLHLVGGLALLVAGGDLLVRGSSRVAVLAGVSPLVVGLTVVAFGTSAPELIVSVAAGLAGEGGIAFGNVIGSNVFNVLFILGVSALVTPLAVARQVVRREVPVMIVASVTVLALALDGAIGRGEAALLATGVVVYVAWSIRAGRRESRRTPDVDAGEARDAPSSRGNVLRRGAAAAGLVVVGLGLLVPGARWLVEGAAALARDLGVTEEIVGLTVVAAGTSMPEAATSVVAAVRGERDIAVGNVVGSNLFNLLAVLGAAGLASPAGLEASAELVAFDLPVMVGVAVACLPVFLSGHRIDRWEGGFFLACYGAYVGYLALVATGRMTEATFGPAAWALVGALGAATVVAVAVGARRSNRGPHGGDAAS